MAKTVGCLSAIFGAIVEIYLRIAIQPLDEIGRRIGEAKRKTHDPHRNIGLFGGVYGITLSAGVNTINFKYVEVEAGIGFMF